MNSQGKPTTPDRPTAAELKTSRIHIEVEYVMPTEQLHIRSACPTIFLQSILLDAIAEVRGLKPRPTPPDGKILVSVDFDIIADRILVTSNAPRLVTQGVLQHALGAVTRNQVQQMFQVYKQGMEQRVAALEAEALKRKILLAGA